MRGGTLCISRAVKNHLFYKMRLETLGFSNVTLSAFEKDALDMLIDDLKPSLLLIGARFFQRSTPYLMGELKKKFPNITMAALSICEYPPEIAMKFIFNGISSYVTAFEGIDEWYKGLEEVRRGREYISPEVKKRISLRRVYPEPAGNLTNRQKEIIALICNGYKDIEIADTLNISRRTVTTHKTDIFTILNVRNPIELITEAQELGIIEKKRAFFYPKDFILNPLPDKKVER
jgi:DNA-binding NarL/FixJ family response regulator